MAGALSTSFDPFMEEAIIMNRSVPAPFLTKTYQLVDDSATDHIVSWNEDETAFVVWRPPEFAKEVLPNYFKHNNFSSFVRQLNTYGFRKVVPERWEFANDYFRRGQMHLLSDIHRRKAISTCPSSPSSSGDGDHTWPPLHSPMSCSSASGVSVSLSDENERLRRDNTLLLYELSRLRKLYHQAIAFLQRQPAAPPILSSNLHHVATPCSSHQGGRITINQHRGQLPATSRSLTTSNEPVSASNNHHSQAEGDPTLNQWINETKGQVITSNSLTNEPVLSTGIAKQSVDLAESHVGYQKGACESFGLPKAHISSRPYVYMDPLAPSKMSCDDSEEKCSLRLFGVQIKGEKSVLPSSSISTSCCDYDEHIST